MSSTSGRLLGLLIGLCVVVPKTQPRRWVAAGYSTGGYCALDLAFRHPDLFGSSISLGGYAHALNDRFARDLRRSSADRLAPTTTPPHQSMCTCSPAPETTAPSATPSPSGANSTAAAGERPAARWSPNETDDTPFPNGKPALLPALAWALPGPHSPLHATAQRPPPPTTPSGLSAPNRCHVRPQPRCLPRWQPSPTVPAAPTSRSPSTTTSSPTPTAKPRHPHPLPRTSTSPPPRRPRHQPAVPHPPGEATPARTNLRSGPTVTARPRQYVLDTGSCPAAISCDDQRLVGYLVPRDGSTSPRTAAKHSVQDRPAPAAQRAAERP